MKASSASLTVSPATLMVRVLIVSPAAKVTVPEGSTPPAKSAALATPDSVKATLPARASPPLRVTWKVNGVEPEWPSAFDALSAAMENTDGM